MEWNRTEKKKFDEIYSGRPTVISMDCQTHSVHQYSRGMQGCKLNANLDPAIEIECDCVFVFRCVGDACVVMHVCFFVSLALSIAVVDRNCTHFLCNVYFNFISNYM